MKGKRILYISTIGLLSVIYFMTSCQPDQQQKGPNIILVMCDQFRFDRLGAMGDTIIQTPNLDALADEGILFTNAYCPSPVCSPSRASLKTGLFPPGNGVVDNWVPFKETIAESHSIDEYLLTNRLKDQGYYTAMVGKLHFVPHEDSFGFDHKVLHDAPYSVYAHDDKFSKYNKWLKDNHFNNGEFDIVEAFDKDESTDNIYDFVMGSGWRTEEQHDIPWNIDECLNFLEQRDSDQPFFLFTSIFGPHQPYQVPEPWNSMYNSDEIVLPPQFYADMSSNPIFQETTAKWANRFKSEWDTDTYKKVIAAYYSQISMIDHYLGKLFNYLKEENLWDNTWIIFLADHGDYNGAYGTFFKGQMYDACAKVPLIIKPADFIDHSVRDELVNTLDIYGSILEIAGDNEWQDLPQMESRSLLPLINSENNTPWDTKTYSIIGNNFNNNLCMLRADSFKIMRMGMGDSSPIYELYNMNDDTVEIHNLYGQPALREIQNKLQSDIDNWWVKQAARYPLDLDQSYKNQ